MASQDTNSSMNQERDTADYRTPTEAVRDIVIQWYRSGPDTSPDRVEFMARLNAPVDIPVIPPTRINPIIPPAISDQVAVSERPLSPSPGPSHRMECINITSITSQKRSQSHSQQQAGGSTKQINNQDNAKKRKLRSNATPPAPLFSPPPSPHLSAIPKTFVSINPNFPKVKIENDYNPIHACKPDPELASVEGRNARSQSDSDSDYNPLITINIQAVLESSSQTESALVPNATHTKSVVQTNEVNYVPTIADSVEDVSCGTDAIPQEAVPVESARDDVNDVKGHSVPVVAVATEVSSNNIVQTETASVAVVDVESEPVGAKVKATNANGGNNENLMEHQVIISSVPVVAVSTEGCSNNIVQTETASVAVVGLESEPVGAKVKATNANGGDNENLMEHQVIISSVPVVAVSTEVSSNNIVQTETASVAVVDFESEPVGAKVKSVKTSAKVKAAKFNSVDAKTDRVKAAKVKAVKVKAAKVKSVKTSKVKAAKVNSVDAKTDRVKAAKVKAVKVIAAKVKAVKVKAAKVKADKAKAGKAKAVKAKATSVDSGSNEDLMEHQVIISSQDSQVATGSSLIQNPATIDANSLNLGLADKKIREEIFRLLSTADLLSCRLVSHLWNSAAVTQLQERIQLSINDNNGPSDYISKCRELRRTLDGHLRTFPWSPLPFKKLGLHKFTCQSGESPFLWPEELELLTMHGAFIHELSLTYFPFSHGHGHNSEGQNPTLKETQEGCLPSEEVLMEEIKHLIINQTPNLTSLTLDVAFKLEGSNAHSDTSPSKRKPLPLLRTDPVLREIYSKLNRNPAVNPKLKFLTFPFNMTHPISAKLLEMISLLAPNLEEIITSEYDYIHFLQPYNRLNFLTSLKITVHTLEDLELFEKIASISEAAYLKKLKNKLTLRHICLCTPAGSFHAKNFPGFSDTEIKSRVVKVINIFLESSKDSLETVKWKGLSFLPESEMWWQSQVMPKVWKLDLGNSFNVGEGQNVLPPAVGWPRLFPNLNCVSTRNIYLLLDCIKYLSLSLSNPEQSVKKIEIHSANPISKENMSLIKAAFPSAKVTRKTN